MTTDALEDTADTLSISILQPRVQNLYDAMGMAEWAINSASIGDFCNRAEIFGRFIAYYDDQEEARKALTFYTESICQKQEIAQSFAKNWMRMLRPGKMIALRL